MISKCNLGGTGLDELQEQFSDGRCVIDLLTNCASTDTLMDRIQYGFSLVLDPNVCGHTTFALSTTSYFLLFRANFPSSYKLTGVAMASRK